MTQSSERSTDGLIEPVTPIRPRRKIVGVSAILLPFSEGGTADYEGFEQHVIRTLEAGLVPAVNMDTGYVNLISRSTRQEVLRRTRGVTRGRRFFAGVFIDDRPGDAWAPDAYRAGIAQVLEQGGIPVIFQSFGFASFSEERTADAYRAITADCPEFISDLPF